MNKTYNSSKILSTPALCKRGFGAAVAVILLSLTSLGVSLAVLAAAVGFSDQVYRHESRIQKNLNQKACDDTRSLMKTKDAFATGTVYLKDFDCYVTL